MGKKPASAQKLTKFVAAANKKPINPQRPIIKLMEAAESSTPKRRHPLSAVVADCVNRWFQDTLKEAKAGDVSMQILLGQMYYSGYGVVSDPHKGRVWINRASKIRSSALKVGDKRPGYNASDSDSDEEVAEDAK